MIIRMCSGDEVIEAQLSIGVIEAGGTMREREREKQKEINTEANRKWPLGEQCEERVRIRIRMRVRPIRRMSTGCN